MLVYAGCSDEVVNTTTGEAPDLTGNPIQFASGVHSIKHNTRALFTDKGAMDAEIGQYEYVKDQYEGIDYLYTFRISMYKEGTAAPLATASYQLAADGEEYATDGTLALKMVPEGTNPPLYWPDNSTKYAFGVRAGKEHLDTDQKDGERFYDNDLLAGYAFEPQWNGTLSQSVDDIDALNYRTSREWYNANKELNPSGNDLEWKKIPLYLKHQRCWITVKLKAGKGVGRNLITYDATESGFRSEMYSYGDSDPLSIIPWRRPATIEYQKDTNGEADPKGETITLNAIVDPYNYLENPEQAIFRFWLNSSKYEFFSSNDSYYKLWYENKDKDLTEMSETVREKYLEAEEAVKAYVLTAGKHLTITATLTTDRIVLITALLEDWEDRTMSSICDDYGLPGNPIQIPDVETLQDFLLNKNKAGNIGIISNTELTLPDGWVAQPLNCMLNLAGATIHSSSRFLDELGPNASLLNGTIDMKGDNEITSAVCRINKGTIEQINVTVAEDAKVFANKGGIANINHGSIIDCVSDLPVKGKDGYVGGIAAVSRSFIDSENGVELLTPVIDQCVVNGKVYDNGSASVSGVGGIAGYAEYRLTRCTFNYGMTLTQIQNPEKYANIVQSTYTPGSEATDSEKLLEVEATDNAWPTAVTNTIGRHTSENANTNAEALYHAVLDCQEELAALVSSESSSGGRYRLADDFDVDNTWAYGKEGASTAIWNNLNFELDGNDKTITTHGKPLFVHINGYFHDMTVYCAESLISSDIFSEEDLQKGTDMLAPFAYSVNKNTKEDLATIQNIKVKMAPAIPADPEKGIAAKSESIIQAANPGGIICEAYNGAKIIDCEVRATLQVKFAEGYKGTEDLRFAGGIAAAATDATFSGCQVHTGTKILQDDSLEGVDGKPFNRQFQYRGGIVGGIYAEKGYTPGTVIQDCNSWFEFVIPGANDSPAGTIIGASKYAITQGTVIMGLIAGEGGNWWHSDVCPPASDLDASEVLKMLGRKNSVAPDEDPNF